MTNREELLSSPEYWTTRIRLQVQVAVNESGISRKELSEKTGIERSYIDRLMNGDREFNLQTMVKILIALEIRPVLTMEKLKKEVK